MKKKNKKILIISGSIIISVVIIFSLIAYIFYLQVKTTLAKSTTYDSEQIANIVKEIGTYELPVGYKEIYASKIYNTTVVAIGPQKGKTGLTILFMKNSNSKRDLSEVLKFGNKLGTSISDITYSTFRDTTIMINNLLNNFEISEGKYKNEYIMKKMAGSFVGQEGCIFLSIEGTEKSWESFGLANFFLSIK